MYSLCKISEINIKEVQPRVGSLSKQIIFNMVDRTKRIERNPL